MLVLDDIFGDIIFGKVRYQKMKKVKRKLMIYYGFNSNDNLINILRYLKNIIK